MDEETKRWAIFIHLSLLAGYFVPFAGFFLPILLWQIKRKAFPQIEIHGRLAVNWTLTFALFNLILGVLGFASFFLNLWAFLLVLGMLAMMHLIGLVYPIIAILKASQNETWHYPGAIPFF